MFHRKESENDEATKASFLSQMAFDVIAFRRAVNDAPARSVPEPRVRVEPRAMHKVELEFGRAGAGSRSGRLAVHR